MSGVGIAGADEEGDGTLSDQWGQPPQPQDSSGSYSQPPNIPQGPYGQQPGAPQGPYNQPQGPYSQPQGPYNQPPQPQGPNPYYGQPVQQPQGPYGQAPQPGPYGPPQPQGPYGMPTTPQPITPENPYGLPQGPYGVPGQQLPFGYPQPGRAGLRKNRNMMISGAVVLVLVVAGIIFVLSKGSGSTPQPGGVNAGTQSQAKSCAAWTAEQNTLNNQNPNTEGQMVSMLDQDVPAMQAIAADAQSGTFKTEMQAVADGFGKLETYLQQNPDIDTTSSTPPPQFVTIDDALLTNVEAVDSTCGLAMPDATGTGAGL
jgi:hypothetical protein